MYQPLSDDTICAMATAHGGAMAVVRVSGNRAIEIADEIFHNRSGRGVATLNPYTATYGSVVDDSGNVVDDVVALLFRAPHSYTGEDVVEISCHGSAFIAHTILNLLTDHGCRMARPGEFSMRAFLNGKMDLSQAEAVADLIGANSAASHRMAISQLRGNFSNQLNTLRQQLLHLTTLLELELDFTEHDVEFADRDQLRSLASDIHHHIERLTMSFRKGNAIKHGIPVAIVGKTNVGKSTLLNRLVHDERAIVSDVHGTTRDVIEDVIQIQGLSFRLIDTAGIRHTDDQVEQMGIERTFRKMEEATIVLWLTDSLPTPEEAQEVASHTQDGKLIAVINKIDRETPAYNPLSAVTGHDDTHIPLVAISAKDGTNVEQLEETIVKVADVPEIANNDVVVTNARHYEALAAALDDITRVLASLDAGLSADLLSADLRSCIDHLAEIVGGEITTEETLQNIFSHFCIGK